MGMGMGAPGASKRTGTDAVVGGVHMGRGMGAAGAAKRMGGGATVGGGARTGTGTGAGAGIYTSSRGSAETSLTPAASSSAIVLGDQPVNATGMVAGAGTGMGAGTGVGAATAAASSFWAMSMRPHSCLFSISSGSELTSRNRKTSGR